MKTARSTPDRTFEAQEKVGLGSSSLSCEDRTGSWPAYPHNQPLLGHKGVSTGQLGQKDSPGEREPQGGLAAGGQSPLWAHPAGTSHSCLAPGLWLPCHCHLPHGPPDTCSKCIRRAVLWATCYICPLSPGGWSGVDPLHASSTVSP